MVKAQWVTFDPLGTLRPQVESTILSVDGFRVAQVFRLREGWRICYFDDSVNHLHRDISQDAVRQTVLNESLSKLRRLTAAIADMSRLQNALTQERGEDCNILHS